MARGGEAGAKARGWWSQRLRSRRFVVHDRSMAPAFLPGDRLLVLPYRSATVLPQAGDVVVLDDPEVPGRWLLKRVVRYRTTPPGPDALGEVEVQGDAMDLSRDSRAFGAVPVGSIIGRAWFRYLPLERRGYLLEPRGQERPWRQGPEQSNGPARRHAG